MATTFSREQFYRLVMFDNAALQIGQDVEAEDRARINLFAAAAFGALEKEGIYGGRGEYENDAIPEAAATALARYVANECGRPDGVPYSEDARRSAEAALKRAFWTTAPATTLCQDFF
jgi:hypothetical protein